MAGLQYLHKCKFRSPGPAVLPAICLHPPVWALGHLDSAPFVSSPAVSVLQAVAAAAACGIVLPHLHPRQCQDHLSYQTAPSIVHMKRELSMAHCRRIQQSRTTWATTTAQRPPPRAATAPMKAAALRPSAARPATRRVRSVPSSWAPRPPIRCVVRPHACISYLFMKAQDLPQDLKLLLCSSWLSWSGKCMEDSLCEACLVGCNISAFHVQAHQAFLEMAWTLCLPLYPELNPRSSKILPTER